MRENLTLRDFMEATSYRITEGDTYCWSCYGSNAYIISSWDGKHDGKSASCVFDLTTQTVYEMSVCDYKNSRAYRWINPEYRKAFKNESIREDSDANQAWDDVNFVDLEMADDLYEKTVAIFNGLDYDRRVKVPLELDDRSMLHLCMIAHDQDITLNALVEKLIRDEIRSRENDKS